MDNSKELILSEEYEAYIPCYNEGNAVLAVKSNGEEIIINRGIRTVLKILLKENNIDMEAVKENFSRLDRKNILMPVPLGVDNILIPAKVRKSLSANDGAFAYVDLCSIKKVSGGNNAVISLKSGKEIQCIESAGSVKRRIKHGNTINDKFVLRMMGSGQGDELAEISSEYSRPATRGDISFLVYTIMKLAKKMED